VRRFTLLTRPGCGLCEEFEHAALAVAQGRCEIEPVLVDHHPAWQAQYGLTIPVLLDAQGRFICAVTVDVNALEAALS